MSWVTVILSMIASACLTLAAIYCVVWYRNRTAWTHLLFSSSAVAAAAFAFCELWIMRAETPRELLTALRWAQIPICVWLLSLLWFVRLHLRAGRLWLAWLVTGLRTAYLLPTLLIGPTAIYREMPSVRQIQFLGETITVPTGVANPWMLVGQSAAVLILVFVADASRTAWQRGERRAALMIGGSTEFFLVAALVISLPVLWGRIDAPMMFSVPYMGLVAVMGYELSRDVLRASRLVRDLQASEAALRELSGRLLSAQEEERRRIARELHDNVSQQVAMLAIRIDQVAAAPADAPGALARSMSDLHHRAVEISTEIHGLSRRLHSSNLEMLGLAEAVRSHCQELLAQGVHARFHSENLPPSLPKDVELCLFRIVQEALNNVVKHSGAREADVTIRAKADVVVLTVADYGRGFDEAGGSLQRGLGLASMRERLRLIDGELTIWSRHGQGTTITARLPMPRAGSAPANMAGVA